jgi:hypothetical protein
VREAGTHPYPDSLTGEQLLPAVSGGEEQHAGRQPVADGSVLQRAHRGIGDHARWAGAVEDVRIAVQLEDDLGRAAVLRDLPQR